MKELIMLISTCDKYSDLWEEHIALLNKNWEDRDVEAYFVTDKEHRIKDKNVHIYSAGEGVEMPQRIQAFLNNISSKYVLYVQDDYFPIKKISGEKIQQALDIMRETNADYLRLFHYPKGKRKVEGRGKYYYLDLNRTYDVNLYPGIWRVEFIKKVLDQNVDIWKLETSLTTYAKENNAVCLMAKNGEYPFLDVVEKGKLHYPAVRYFKKQGIRSEREKMSWLEEMYFRLTFYARSFLPKTIFIFIKRVMKRFGYHFYSDMY